MRNKIFIAIFAGLAIISLLIILKVKTAKTDASAAEIVQDGNVIQTVDLSSVSEPYDITLRTEDGGYNTIHVEQGSIRVSEADCPDRLCVKQGEITNGIYPIVCLPHRLTVRIVENSGIDAVTGR